jgi:hypothetical protein
MVTLIDYKYLVMSVLQAPLEEMGGCLTEVLSEKSLTARYARSVGALKLESVYVGRPLSGGRRKLKAVMYCPSCLPSWTVFIANSEDGWQTLVNCLSAKTDSNVISILLSDDSMEFPRNSFELLRRGRTVRTVYSMLDGDRWEFFEKGEVQTFEDPANYTKRKKRDRLDRMIVLRYLSRIGIDPTDECFWASDKNAAYLVEL